MDAILATLLNEFLGPIQSDATITYDSKVLIQTRLQTFCDFIVASQLVVPA